MLRVPAAVIAAILADCDRRRPDEACGLLIGDTVAGVTTVVRSTPVENVWPDVAERPGRYAIDPLTQARAESAAIADGVSLVGFYHSHPNGPPLPSGFDAERAWPTYVYLIVGFAAADGAKHPTLRVWALDAGGAFVEHSIETHSDF